METVELDSTGKEQSIFSARNWQELISPRMLKVEQRSDEYGKFTCEPLERGFGVTLGNSLRRMLLSSLQGAAITHVRIDSVLHEFAHIHGVVEDVTEIILNLKGALVSVDDHKVYTGIINKKGPGIVTAADIEFESGVTVINPDHTIATLSGDAEIKIEMLVSSGRGYTASDAHEPSEDLSVDMIPIDSVFSPVKKVNFNVTHARVGQQTDYDKLSLEVWTDGSVTPDDAIAFAAKILKEQLTIFINFDEIDEETNSMLGERVPKQDENLWKTVDELELSVRSANCLENANIKYIGQLVQKTESEMLRTKNFGRKSLKEIREILQGMELHLGMKIDSWSGNSMVEPPPAPVIAEPQIPEVATHETVVNETATSEATTSETAMNETATTTTSETPITVNDVSGDPE